MSGLEAVPSRWELLGEVFPLWLPMVFNNVMMLANEICNTICIGRTGNAAELAAVGLGNMMQNCCALSLGLGLTSALDTFVSQAHGAGQRSLCVQYLQRSRAVTATQLVWMIPLLWFSDSILLAVGQHADVARHAAAYNRAASLGLLGSFQFQGILSYLRNVAVPQPMWITGITSLLHVVWAVLFVVALGWGNLGAGIANITTWTLQWLIASGYLVCKAPELNASWQELLGLQPEAFRHWRAYLAVAIPTTLQMCSEWWFWEICALLVGYLGPAALAAHVATMNMVTILVMPSIALGEAASTVVGNAIGARLPRKAKSLAWLCVGLDAVMWTCLAITVLLTKGLVAHLLTSDAALQSMVQTLLAIYLLAGYPDNISNVIGSTLRGMGKQKAPVLVYLFSLYFVMLPAGCTMTWPCHMGVQGMWFSMPIGTGLVTFLFGILLWKVDWEQCVWESDERLRAAARKEGLPAA